MIRHCDCCIFVNKCTPILKKYISVISGIKYKNDFCEIYYRQDDKKYMFKLVHKELKKLIL